MPAARVVLLALASVLPAAAAPAPLTVPDAFTPVLVRFVGDRTAPVKGSDGRWHVVYELWLTNARPLPATVERIEVLDYDDQTRVVTTLEGDALRAATHELSTAPAADTTLAPNASKLVFVELAFDEATAVPDRIVHRLGGTGADNPGSRRPGPIRYLVAPWDIAEETPRVIAAPLQGAGWVAINGCCSARGAHRGAVLPVDGTLRDSQRFAIDWMRISPAGKLVDGDPAKVESYLGYDAPVLAVADGTVVEVLDGLDDQVPGELPDPTTITVQTVDGNHVILDLGGGVYAFYAHLKKGSIRVKPGDRVKTGQELGRLGNTGNTSGPHLHLHLMNAPSALASDGLPYVFDRFTLTGMLDPERWFAPDGTVDETYRILPGDGPGERTDALPLEVRVVTFE